MAERYKLRHYLISKRFKEDFMGPKVAIIGAGIVGASIARHLARAGAQVTVIEGDQPANHASGRSFGWINASFFPDDAYFRLRAAGITAYHRLAVDMPDLAVTWPGCLWWQEQGEALDAMAAKLTDLGYPLEKLGKNAIRERAPELGDAPEEALFFPHEGVAETGRVTHQMLAQACDAGARIISGCRVGGFDTQGGRISGVVCEQGLLRADHVIVAAGIGSAALMEQVGVRLPMLRRPGALMYSRPVRPVLPHIMVSPELEFRQGTDGRIVAPHAAKHQSDSKEKLTDTPEVMAEDTLTRLQRLLPGVPLEWHSITVAMRPVPGDGLPAVGPCGPEGMYLATMHSGITLGALMGELVSREVLGGEAEPLLTPYRPQRFG